MVGRSGDGKSPLMKIRAGRLEREEGGRRASRPRCYPRNNPPPRQVYRVEGQSGSIGQTYEGGGYYIGGQTSR